MGGGGGQHGTRPDLPLRLPEALARFLPRKPVGCSGDRCNWGQGRQARHTAPLPQAPDPCAGTGLFRRDTVCAPLSRHSVPEGCV